MSIYTLIPEEVVAEPLNYDLRLTERDIYGSSRLGTENINQVIASTTLGHININTDLTQVVGDKNYELSNLPTKLGIGNVLQVVTDRKLAIDSGDYNPESGTYYTMILGGDGVVDYYVSDVVTQSDYYPFGMMLPGRNSSDDSYRYGFQGQEMDDEIKGEGNSANYKYRMHDPRVGRFFAVDPLASKYPHNSPYAFSENKVIHAIELEGLEAWEVKNEWTKEYIDAFNVFSITQGEKYRDGWETFSCEDLALQILIDYASQNGLPVNIINGKYPSGVNSSSEKFSNVEGFKNEVLKTTGASDLESNTNTVGEGMSGLENSKAGDIILLDTDNNNASDHVQIFYKNIADKNEVIVLQGNQALFGFGSADPESFLYDGAYVVQGLYNTDKNYYNGVGETNDAEGDLNPTVVQWDFEGFNDSSKTSETKVKAKSESAPQTPISPRR